MTDAVFHKELLHKELLKHYQVVDKPGSFIVAVAQDITDQNLYTGDDYPRYLIPYYYYLQKEKKLLQLLNIKTMYFYVHILN